MNELITVKQLPVIEERLKELSEEIDLIVENALSLVCTSDTVKEVRKTRADLNNQFEKLEAQRKAVKGQILKPYNDFEDIYKKYVTEKFKKANSELKNKIDAVEDELKNQKEEELRIFANECFVKNEILEYVSYENIGLNVTLSASMKSLKEQIVSFCENVVKDLTLISTQEFKDEMFYEYKKDLNVSRAVMEVQNRHVEVEKIKQVEEEKQEQKLTDEEMLKKIESLSAPKAEDTEIYELIFKVRGTKTKLKKLKEFLENERYDYE